MAEFLPADERSNYETFRDCLSEPVLRALAIPTEKSKPKKKRHAKKGSKEKIGMNEKSRTHVESKDITSKYATRAEDAEDLGEFIEVQQITFRANASH
jgi:hypothetical protein